MRESIILGLLALAFGIFGSTAFAGNVEDCEFLKDKSHPDYAPGLYGLCVAWHNADEDAKDELADMFFDRAGFEVPGSDEPEDPPDFLCPCWDELTFEDVCALGAPLTVTPGVQVQFNDGITFEGFLSPNGSTACRHTVQDLSDGSFLLDELILGLDAEAALDCQAERDIISVLYLDPACTSP
jgi:hypothetical protein